MRAMITIGLLALVLAACGGATPTLAPYTGAKMHGYPTPDTLAVLSDDADGVYLTVRGDPARTATRYAESWRADGWAVVDRQDSDDFAVLTVSLHGGAPLVLDFGRWPGIRGDGTDSGTMVHIPPFTRYDWNR
jgi:hypothetical protein